MSKYHAFISYSHAADGQLAPALQKALHQIAKPWYKARALHVFRDATSLAATPALWNSIETALHQSEYLILLASPEAARSVWVQKEVDFWLANKSIDTILIGLTEGEIAWADSGDFDWTRTNALPTNLKGKFAQEPLYVDLRDARTSADLSLSNPEFKKKAVILAAALHGKTMSDLVGEEVEQHRKTLRIRNAAIGVLSVLFGISSIAAWWALDQTEVANERTVYAEQQQQIAVDSARSAQTQRLLAQQSAQMARDSADYARRQETFARQQQRLAEQQRNLAIAAQQESVRQQKIAEIQRDSARLERDIAEANRIATQALNLKNTDPNLALRVAEAAYRMQPERPNTAQALSAAFYDFFENKAAPYQKEVQLDQYKVSDAWLLSGQQAVVFATSLQGGTYYLNLTNNEVKKLADCAFDVLTAQDGSFFITNSGQGTRHPDCRKEPVTLWSGKGEPITELLVPGDTISEVRILPQDKYLIAQTRREQIAVFDATGKLKKVWGEPGERCRLPLIYEKGKKWCTADGQFFFAYSKDAVMIFDYKGELLRQYPGRTLVDVAQNDEFLLLNGPEGLELAGIYTEEVIRLEGVDISPSPESFSQTTSLSTGSKYVIFEEEIGSVLDESGEKKSRVVVWDRQGNKAKELEFLYAAIQKVETSADDAYLMVVSANSHRMVEKDGFEYSMGDNDYMRIWKIEDIPEPVREIKIYNNDHATPKPSFLGNNNIVLMTQDNTLAVQDFLNSKVYKTLSHTTPIKDYRIDPERRMIFSEAGDATKIWDFEGKLILSIPAIRGARSEVKVQQEEILTHTAYGKNLKIWRFEKDLFYDLLHGGPISEVQVSDDQQRIVTSSYLGISVWNRQGKLLKQIVKEKEKQSDFHARFFPHSHKLLTWSTEEICTWDALGNQVDCKSLDFGGKQRFRIHNAVFRSGGKSLITHDIYGNALIWKTDKLKMSGVMELKGYSMLSKLSPSGKKFVLNASKDTVEQSKLVLWHENALLVDTIQLNAPVSQDSRIGFSNDEERLVTPGPFGSAVLWSKRGKKLVEYPQHNARVNGAMLSPDEKKVLTYTYGKVYIWNADASGRKVIDMDSTVYVRDAQFSPDAQSVVVTTHSRKTPLLVYDTTGQLIAQSNAHIDVIDQVVFSPDGKYFITATGKEENDPFLEGEPDVYDYSAKLWNSRGDLLADFNKHGGQITAAGFLDGGDYLYTASQDGTMKIFPAPHKIFRWLQTDSKISPLSEAQKSRYGIR